MIKQHFASLANPSPERPRAQFDVPEHPGTRFAIFTDKETTNTAVELSDPRPRAIRRRSAVTATSCSTSCSPRCSGSRLDELTQSATPPFLRAAADRGLFPMPRTKDEVILQALVPTTACPAGSTRS